LDVGEQLAAIGAQDVSHRVKARLQRSRDASISEKSNDAVQLFLSKKESHGIILLF